MLTKAQKQIKRRFGERIKELRREQGLSQEALAQECDLDRTYIGGAERGERNVSLVNIYRMAIALRVPPGTLLQPVQDEGHDQ